ncbi:MAG: type II toxin-antitoxin system RelE/ParE family toxin [Coriobacteriaceae bacterium]|nr:type II toxin-antitoxin system RelE/ParE family toxin [Coriobacteriaceae bacterium]
MATRVVVTRKAAIDIAGIYAYIKDTLASPVAAADFLDELEKGVDFLRAFPKGRPLCSDLFLAARGYRSFRIKEYIAIYSIKDETVHILHVFHRSQDYAAAVLSEERR